MMRILYVFVSLPVGGAEQILLSTMKHLAGRQIQPLVCCIRSKGPIGEEIEKLGVEVVSLGHRNKSFDWSACRKLARLIKERNIDLVHAQLYHGNFYGRIAAMLAGVPAIATEQNIYPRVKLKRRVANWLLAKKTARVIAVSEAVRGYVVARDWLAPEKVITVPNCVDLSPFNSVREKAQTRTALSLPLDAFIVGNVGRLENQKGQRLLIEAAKLLRKKIPNLLILIVGQGNVQAELAAQIAAENLGDCVRLLGVRRDIPEILQALDVFALPSRWEGLPIALLEAMAARLPVVATPVGGIPEFLRDGANGLVIPVGDATKLAEAIDKLFQDRALADQLGQQARETVTTHFSADTMVAKLEALYQTILADHAQKNL